MSGMLGLGAAFATIPYLSLFMTDVMHEVQPVALLLNGFTAAFSAAGFARSKLIRWRDAFVLVVITTASAPIGSLLVQYVPSIYVWVVYFVAVLYLAYRLFNAGEGKTPASRLSPRHAPLGSPQYTRITRRPPVEETPTTISMKNKAVSQRQRASVEVALNHLIKLNI
ncbi:MAG: sulfite exporter TauE/SafE family protein [Fervidicoccaceae archaeon]|nr:sulfite exporter TauE/SafE family protein [Fervidicoccaceae archaeon]